MVFILIKNNVVKNAIVASQHFMDLHANSLDCDYYKSYADNAQRPDIGWVTSDGGVTFQEPPAED